MTDLQKKLSKGLIGYSGDAIFLIETSASKILAVHLAVVKLLGEQNYIQVILSASRPCKNLFNLYTKNGIDTSKLMIICTCCRGKERDEGEKSGVIHLADSSSLTDISLSLGGYMETKKDKESIFIDSITTLLIHNNPNAVAKFIHSMLTKMRTNNVSGLLLSLEAETDKEVRAEIAQLCDKMIKI